VLPAICERKIEEQAPKTLRFWSAGCSTGEEPYTLAMMLREHLPNFSDWSIEILANDISEEALRKARQGEYSGATLRKVPSELLTKYFEQKDRVVQIVPEIRRMVKFAHCNLNEPQRVPFTDRFDVIFCRNVMIYFAEPVKRTLIRNFYNSLRPGGYFFVGHAETLHGLSKAFKLVYFRNALVYQKELVLAGTTSTYVNHATPALTKQGKH
jgi:chemotaxis protein methyltransferase CheR